MLPGRTQPERGSDEIVRRCAVARQLDSTGGLLSACLRAVGARRVFGRPIAGLEHHQLADDQLARLLSEADGRIGPGAGVALTAEGVLWLSSAPGARPERYTISDPAELPSAIATWSVGQVHSAREYLLDFDLTAPIPADVEPLQLDAPPQMYSLSPSLGELAMIVLVGPGVVREGQVDALRAFATQVGAGVLNTWGAKGVLEWDDPSHLGTVGLQRDDYELAGLADSELIISVGIDEAESPNASWQLAQHLDVEPASLAALAFNWDPSQRVPERPRLYSELASVLGPHFESDLVPLDPARAAADLASALAHGGLVVGDPGPAGLWLARAFPTREEGSVIVPATQTPGFAAAGALVAALDGRRTVAVTTGPCDESTQAILDQARRWELPLVLEVWGGDGPLLAPDERADALSRALAGGAVFELPVPVDFSATRALVEVAGPVTAWTD